MMRLAILLGVARGARALRARRYINDLAPFGMKQ